MEIHKYKIGDKVIYEGLVGIIEILSSTVNGIPSYSLVAEENDRLSCMAFENELEPYNDQEIDQSRAIREALGNSASIIAMVESITDKYIGDE